MNSAPSAARASISEGYEHMRIKESGVDRAFDRAYYQRFYVNRHTRVISSSESALRGRFVASFLQQLEVPVAKILDMGCGLGGMKRPLLKIFPQASYRGVEISEYACKRYGWTQSSIQDFRTRERFDLVVCMDVVQYLDDRAAASAITQLAQWCRGVLYFFVPTREDWSDNVDHTVTDTRVFVRSAQWYQQRLRRHFVHLGNGFLARRNLPLHQWALQQPWR
jgi:SAM-dependent methyltransferase